MRNETIFWNNVYLDLVRRTGGGPGPIARAGALMHAAMFNAINSTLPAVSRKTAFDGFANVAPAGASKEAALAHAASKVLKHVYGPEFNGLIDRKLKESTLYFTGGVADGQAIGEVAAMKIINERGDSGSNSKYMQAIVPGYSAPTGPGQWRPTGSGNALGPNWSELVPFAMATSSAFRPPFPGGFSGATAVSDLLKSEIYASQWDDVRRVGRYDSTERTADQTEIAFFWANDVDGTSKPPGQLYGITQGVAQARMLNMEDTARLFALVAIATVDASILAWDAKYKLKVNLWRPETAIQRAFEDDNERTSADLAWKPLSAHYDGFRFSPNFPAYVSGHATFGAAHARVMEKFFGTDNISFTVYSEDPHMPRDGNGVKKGRHFTSFSQAAKENGRSRIYLGVHYQWDADAAYDKAREMVDSIIQNKFMDWPL